ncbi:MAG: Rrf2 family transcriptional regulator [Dehalococcoidales bacterium]|nr:Rrf2 family transcriptional regulator [Dehalococcoidales bacterium]
MKLSTRARYGTRALLDLVRQPPNEPVQLKEIARRQGVSLHYLEHLITPLITAGIIRSIRGARGGVKLARPAEQISLAEIIRLLEGSLTPVECIDKPDNCPRAAACATRDVWSEMQQIIQNFLEGITLRDMAERQKNKDAAGQTMYYV